ncbi:ATP-dependent Clp protease proteolytic subunit [Methyloceanibacter caenitepidi]|uniref:ATP-dependent Clp protease proteolytic subunit n=1 Tax=Methyloceanibacter caenitepidi TaxID=1384459 RepID=A0A0A8K648_9HYPH|nr:ATP-dependent Clp protease proteolytic subunit [Methyloceanibacter caenitepidi]
MIREHAAQLVRRDATPRPSTWNPEARTITCVVATPTPVRRQDQRGAFDEILDVRGADIAAFEGAHVLNGHAQGGVEGVIGTVERAWIEGDQLLAEVRFSARPEVEGIVGDIAQGIIRGVSVGYEVETWADGERDGTRTRTATKWKPRELSFVTVPADPNARTRSHESGRANINRSIRELGTRCGVSRETVDALIDREATIEEARTEMLNHMTARSRVEIRTGQHTLDDPQVRTRAMGEALYVRSNPRATPSGPAREYVGMSVADMARETLRRSGIAVMGLGAPALIERALHSTSDFSLILGDTVGRSLRDGYEAAEGGIRTVARETTASDFRAKSRLVLDGAGIGLDKVNEAGEFKSGTMAEAAESYALSTYGRIFGLSRQALVNDDVGAFTDLPRRLGQAAAAFEADQLVALLEQNSGLGPTMSDTNPLFDAAHGNVQTTGAAPGETTLSAGRLAMRAQTGPGGALIAVTPRYLIVPAALETASEKLLATITPTKTDDVAPFSNLTLIVEPRLSSATGWYLVADPAQVDGLEYAYLASEPGPQISTQTGFRVDGVEVKVRLDYGCGFVDWRGWYFNDGA